VEIAIVEVRFGKTCVRQKNRENHHYRGRKNRARIDPLKRSMRGMDFAQQKLAAAIRRVSTNTDSSFLLVTSVKVEIAIVRPFQKTGKTCVRHLKGQTTITKKKKERS
jgi:hypothetical protein